MDREDRPLYPKLRFSEFTADWERKPLSTVLRVKGRRNSDNKYGKDDVLSVSGDLGIINQIEHMGRSYAGALVNNYHVVDTGDIVYTKSPLKFNPYGIIKANKGRPGIVSTLYAVYEVMPEHDASFWDRYFELDDHVNRYLKPLVNKGAKNDMKINNDRVLIDPITAPSLVEQRKIASFLDVVDRKLNELRRKSQLLTDYKQGLMQQLFSQQLRFRRDDGGDFPTWEEKRFGEMFSWVQTNSLSREHLTFSGGTIQNIHYGDVHSKFRATFRQSRESTPFVASSAPVTFSPAQYCRPGDVVIADASEDLTDIGKALEVVEVREQSLVSGLHTLLARPRTGELALGFSGYLLRSEPMRRQIMKIAQGISVLGISKGNMEKLRFWLPHPDEQRRIADFLDAIDYKIDAVETQVTQTAYLKKALLQQMFV